MEIVNITPNVDADVDSKTIQYGDEKSPFRLWEATLTGSDSSTGSWSFITLSIERNDELFTVLFIIIKFDYFSNINKRRYNDPFIVK